MKNTSINWIFLRRLSIQNHLKPSIPEKKQSKTKYPTGDTVSPEFVKKPRMSDPVKSLGYIKCYSLSSLRLIKSNSISKRYNCQKILSKHILIQFLRSSCDELEKARCGKAINKCLC